MLPALYFPKSYAKILSYLPSTLWPVKGSSYIESLPESWGWQHVYSYFGTLNSVTEWHFDTTTAYNLLLVGEKRWEFFSLEHSLAFYEFVASKNFNIGIEEPIPTELVLSFIEQYNIPLLSVIQQAGQLVLVPQGVVHKVTNISDFSFAVASNHLSASDLQLGWHNWTTYRPKELHNTVFPFEHIVYLKLCNNLHFTYIIPY